MGMLRSALSMLLEEAMVAAIAVDVASQGCEVGVVFSSSV